MQPVVLLCSQLTSTKQKRSWQLLLPGSIPFNTYRCTGWWWKQDRLSVPAKWSSHVSQDLYRGLQSDVYARDLPVSKEKHYNMKHFSSVSKNTSVLVAHNIINFKNSNIKKAKKAKNKHTKMRFYVSHQICSQGFLRLAHKFPKLSHPFFSLLSFFFLSFQSRGDVHALTGKPQFVSVKKLNFLVSLLTQVQQLL